jgi:hypothetical protein
MFAKCLGKVSIGSILVNCFLRVWVVTQGITKGGASGRFKLAPSDRKFGIVRGLI